MEKQIEIEVIKDILHGYGIDGEIVGQEPYIHYIGKDDEEAEVIEAVKLIFGITLDNGRRLVVKILNEDGGHLENGRKIESQSAFSEFLRGRGVKTPTRYSSGGAYCTEYVYRDVLCNVTVEDWCGEEIREITPDIAHRIGVLMARMHTLSLDGECKVGCGTLFSAAHWNDVDAFPEFCKLCEDERLDAAVTSELKRLHDEKLERIRSVWDTLPKAAVQGDVSINNLVDGADGLIVFDYNNAGDEVLVSDLVMEGLLTAYEMDLPEGVSAETRGALFDALLRGYLSVRPLNEAESRAAWDIYTMYNSLWFTRVVYSDGSLQKLVEQGDYASANALLRRMLADMTAEDDGRFTAKT